MAFVETAFIRSLGSLLSRGGRAGSLCVLIYHRVLPSRDALLEDEIDRDRFEGQVSVISENFNILPLAEAVERVRSGSLPSRALSMTFDDGYANNAELALPILSRYRVPATFFISAGYLDGGIMWNDVVIEAIRQAPGPILRLGNVGLDDCDVSSLSARRAALSHLLSRLKYLPQEQRGTLAFAIAEAAEARPPANLMMTTDQLRGLHRAGMEIGGHTLTHPILAGLAPEVARQEIIEGRDRLVDILRSPVRLFAYPNGQPKKDYAFEHVAMVRESGFSAAVSTAIGAATSGADPYQLPRFTPWDRTPLRFSLRLLQNYSRTGFDLATA